MIIRLLDFSLKKPFGMEFLFTFILIQKLEKFAKT
jgi:hypothetical protein